MDVKQVERLEALLSKATPGEWAQYGPDVTDAEGVPLFGLLGAKEADDTALVVAMKAALPALLQLARVVSEAATGEVIEIGDDEEGQPRVLIHSTRDELRKGPPLPFKTVALVPVPVKEG